MINIPVSIGELFDKITILEIKLSNVKNKNKIQNIKKEYSFLMKISKQIYNINLEPFILELKQINTTLWNIENKIREKEKAQEFDLEFIEIARSVYLHNDLRAKIKRKINEITNSVILEEKEHS